MVPEWPHYMGQYRAQWNCNYIILVSLGQAAAAKLGIFEYNSNICNTCYHANFWKPSITTEILHISTLIIAAQNSLMSCSSRQEAICSVIVRAFVTFEEVLSLSSNQKTMNVWKRLNMSGSK